MVQNSILVVDDDRLIRSSLSHALEGAGYEVDAAQSAGEAIASLRRRPYGLLLLDCQLPDLHGVQVLGMARDLDPHLPVVMITAQASLDGAVEAVKAGADEYLAKPFELDHLLGVVARFARERSVSVAARPAPEIVATSPAMIEVLGLVERVARSQTSTVLLQGESGVGKGLVAQALHRAGPGARRPFVNVTCTSLSPSLLESELFGHERGAFTDARSMKRGLFELADGGTLFLDEIGDMPLDLQAKLIRFLEDQTFRRVGGTRDLTVSLRIVAATHRELADLVEQGRFRRDLYYRLKVIPIEIPPLRERRADILPLAQHFTRGFAEEFGAPARGFDGRAEELMQGYDWPGNVRELRNAVERAVLLAGQKTLGPCDLPEELQLAGAQPAAFRGIRFRLPAEGLALRDLERSLVTQALARCDGNRTRAARMLGLNRDQIRYRIEKYGLEAGERAR